MAVVTEYKYKPEKHKYRVKLKTIDEIHKERLCEFKKKRDTLPEKKKRLIGLEKDLEQIEQDKKIKGIEYVIGSGLIRKRNQIKNNIQILKDEIYKIENYDEEMEYWSKGGDILCDYYNLTNGLLYGKNYENPTEKNKIDNKENTEIDNTKIVISDELLEITNYDRKRKLKKPVRKRNKRIEITPNRSIMSILLGDEQENEQDITQCKATLQNQYLLIMDKEYACSKSTITLAKKCALCNVDKIIIYNESVMSCPICGDSDEIFIESDMPSQRETFAEKPKYPYKKTGHCIEKLNQFLCKGTPNIPPHVFTILNDEMIKHVIDKDCVTIQFLERMLKKRNLSEHYENIMYIFSKITGKQPLQLTREEYDIILKMFDEAEKIYEQKYKPAGRDNFLKYTFVLNKIIIAIGRPDIAEHFKLLKSPEKLKQQERVWQKICNELGWKYHSS